MFDFLEGELARKAPTEAVLAVNGVGYLLSISLQTFAALPERGHARLFVQVHTTDSSSRLFGFADERERHLFRLLQTVNGVGPAVALTLLSSEPAGALGARIRSGDVKGLTRTKGIGTKTAERLVLELKAKVVADPDAVEGGAQEALLVQALESLGLDASEAAARARATLKAMPGEERVESLLRHALQSRAAAR